MGTANRTAASYLSGFQSVPFFYPGPRLRRRRGRRAQEMRELGIGYSEPIYIHIRLGARLRARHRRASIGWPVTALESDSPASGASSSRTTCATPSGATAYPTRSRSTCSDGGSRLKISCRDADKVAVRLPQGVAYRRRHTALNGDGGDDRIDRPRRQFDRPSSPITARQILPGTGFKGKGGVADYTVYSRIRFPMAEAPAFANSQSFMNWGNARPPDASAPARGRIAAYAAG